MRRVKPEYGVVETERLTLVPIGREHTEDIFREFTYSITEYMYPAPAKDMREERRVVSAFMRNGKKGKEYVYAITLKDGEFIGMAGLHDLDKERPEFGIWTKASAHGNGYGREAIRGLFDRFTEYDNFLYPVDERNIPSRRIPESLGGILVGGVKEQTSKSGRTLRTVEYYIDRKSSGGEDAVGIDKQ